MARRLVLVLVECLVALILTLSVALLWASYYIDTPEFRALFTDSLKTVLGRDVELAGDLDIAVWPELALKVEGLDVGEDPAFGVGSAAHFDDVSFKVRVLPLFSRLLEAESIVVNGFRGVIVQNAAGRFNWQSIVEHEFADGGGMLLPGWDFSIQSIELRDADILFRDEMANTQYKLDDIVLKTGSARIGEDVPFSVHGGFSWKDKGIVSDLILSGMVNLTQDGNFALKDATVQASVYGDFLPENAEPGEFVAGVELDMDKRTVRLNDIETRFFGIRAEGDLESGDLRQGLDIRGHVTVHPFSPAVILAKYTPELPVKEVDGLKSSALASYIRVTGEGVSFDNLVLTLDDITVRGQIGFQGYTQPVFNFALRGDTLDLDRYLPLFRTGTPFLWDDFSLPFFRAFRGKGSIRADGFQVLDTLISDIRLQLEATDAGITVDAGAIREGIASLGGKLEVAVGSSGQEGVPTLALSASIDAESQKRGFAFLHRDALSIGGAGLLRLKAKVAKMDCPPQTRSIFLLRHLDCTASLSLGEGAARFGAKGDSTQKLTYSKADLEVRLRPGAARRDDFYDCNLTAGVKTRGGGEIESVTATAEGPLAMAIDDVHVMSGGLKIDSYLSSSLLPQEAKRLTASGTVAFDSKTASASVANVAVQILETGVGGNVRLTGLDGSCKAEGDLSIAQADPKRIIYLLTGKSLATRDAAALKSASAACLFSADGNGFVLSQFEGALDNMPVRGHVVGTGYAQPLFAFSLAAGAFNLDRYLSPKKAQTLREKQAGIIPTADPVDLPLDFLRFLKLNGKVSFTDFTLAKIRTESLTGFVTANEGLIHISKIEGKCSGGTLNADWKGETGTTELSTQLTLEVDHMQAGPFMAELVGREYVRGESDVKMDLRSKGKTDDDILKKLFGTASLRVTNGSFKLTGYDAPDKVEKQTNSQKMYKQMSRKQHRTVFNKAVADFTVTDGVFKVDKFRLEAPPVLQSHGEGSFSLPNNTIDMAIRNDFVAVPSVTILLKGELTNPKVEVPTGRILNDTVFNILSLPKKSFEFLRDLF